MASGSASRTSYHFGVLRFNALCLGCLIGRADEQRLNFSFQARAVCVSGRGRYFRNRLLAASIIRAWTVVSRSRASCRSAFNPSALILVRMPPLPRARSPVLLSACPVAVRHDPPPVPSGNSNGTQTTPIDVIDEPAPGVVAVRVAGVRSWPTGRPYEKWCNVFLQVSQTRRPELLDIHADANFEATELAQCSRWSGIISTSSTTG
jgi:hypothetical protein